MTIQDFAIKNRLKVRQDKDDGTDIIPGRPSFSHIYEYSDDELGVMFASYATVHEPPRPRLWNTHSRKALAAGMTLRQNGDAEGAFSFDPANPVQAKLAIRVAGVKRKRRITEEQRAAKAAILAFARSAKAITTMSGMAL
jgi:hypothetical protein